ncbi:MAG: aminotransferase class IV [Paludibacter sp.]
MSQFLETIQLQDGEFKRLELHQARLVKSLKDYYPNMPIIFLENALKQQIIPKVGLFKCRVVYDCEIQLIEFIPYTPPIIRSLKIIETDIPSLPYKMAERAEYQKVFTQRGNCDDVLLVKNGLLTDSSYCNIALFDGYNWFTPKQPLIQGVNRAQLLSEGRMMAKDIKLDELVNFQSISLFNALNEFGTIEMKLSSIQL